MSLRLILATVFILSCAHEPQRATVVERQPQPEAPAAIDWALDNRELPRAFEGEGARIEITPIRSLAHPEWEGRYFIRVTGVSSDFNGLVMPARLDRRIRGDAFVSIIHGHPRTLLLFSSYAGKAGWLHYRDHFRAAPISLVPTIDRGPDPATLLASYREHLASGLIERVAPESRSGRERDQDSLFAGTLHEVHAACGDLHAEIDWSTVEDGAFERNAVFDHCSQFTGALTKFCTSYPHAKPVVQKTGTWTCEFHGDPESYKGPAFTMGDQGAVSFVPGPVSGSWGRVERQLPLLFGEKDQVVQSKNHTFIFRFDGKSTAVYSGDGKVFWPNGSGYSNLSDDLPLESGAKRARIVEHEGKWSLQCGDDTEELVTLVGGPRESILAGAQYEAEPHWKREPYFLARDSMGVYYYVDRYQAAFGGKHYRVFVGRRGQSKLTKLKGLVEDTEGTLFSTEKGDLRLIVSPRGDTATWIRGKREIDLVSVSVFSNRGLIYDELGVYFGEELGLVCGN